MWFPDKGESTKAAKKICKKCPVTETCKEFAVNNIEVYGIWGGTSDRERKRIRRERRAESEA